MYDVTFPGLGLEFHLNPTAFTIFGQPIQWYGIIIAVGFLLAFIYAMASCKKMKINDDKLLNCVIAGIVGGVIGARLFYVVFQWDMYKGDLLSILDIRKGGLAIYGGIIGGLLCGVLAAKLSKIKIAPVLDIAALGFLIGQGIGRWGNFVNQEAFGTQTNLPWGMVSQATDNVAVHPCFLYESLWCLLGFVLLHIFTRKFRRYDGQTFILYLVWYGLERFFVEQLRTDSLFVTDGSSIFARISVTISLLCVLVGVILLIVFRNKTSLSGCGSRKIMAMNMELEEIPQEMIEEEESTIFPGQKLVKEEVNAEEEQDDPISYEPAIAEPGDAETQPEENFPETEEAPESEPEK